MGEQGNKLVEWFVRVAVRLDRRLRPLEWASQRSFDGRSKRYFGVDGYSPLALLVFAAALVFQILGPSLGWRGGLTAVALPVAAPILLGVPVYLLGANRLWWAEFITILSVSALVFFAFAAPGSREPDDLLYRHVLAPALWLLLAAMPPSPRTRGGPGIHWILPNTVRLRDAVIADPDASSPSSVVLSGEQRRTIIDRLSRVDRDPCGHVGAMPDPRLRAVWNWIGKDPVHGPEWYRLEADLGH